METFLCNTTVEVMGKLFREDGEEVTSLFHPPRRRPATTQEEKMVLAQVLKIAIQAVLKNHTYQFGGEVRLQEEGGPIVLELAGALARTLAGALPWSACMHGHVHGHGRTHGCSCRRREEQDPATLPTSTVSNR